MRPTFAFSRPRLLALASGVVALASAPVGGMAQTTVSAASHAGKMLEYTVCGTAATFPLDVSTGTPTMVELPHGFDKFLHDDATQWVVKRDGNKLYIAPPRDTPAGEELAVRIRATRPVPFETSLHIRAVRRVRGIDDNVVIYHQTDEKRFGQHPEENPCISRGLSPTQRLRIRAFDRQHSESRAIGVPEIDHVARSGHGVPIELTMYEMDAGNLVLDFGVNNRYATATEVTDVRVLNSNRQVVLSEIWRWNDEGVFSARKKVAIAAFQDVRASIYIPNADKQDLEPMWVEFRGTRGASPFMASMQVGTFRHMTPEEIEQMQREDELRRQREEEHRQREKERRRLEKLNAKTTVSISPLGGVNWLSDGANQGILEPTSLGGIAVRVQKGYYWGGALEATITGAKTGEVRFEDMLWDNTQGDVTRQAKLVRVLGGAAMRFGDRLVFTGRLGLGFQVVVNDSRFLMNGTPADGPSDGTQVQGVWSIGAGFDRRLGAHWALGITAAFTDAFNSDPSPSLEAGLQLGYGWN